MKSSKKNSNCGTYVFTRLKKKMNSLSCDVGIMYDTDTTKVKTTTTSMYSVTKNHVRLTFSVISAGASSSFHI